MASAQQGTNSSPAGESIDAPQLRLFVMGLFFIFGGITSLNDVIIPKLKELFTLNYTQAMLVQFCFFAAYAVIGIPGAQLVKRIGYMRCAVVGLLTMMAGCLLFIPASQSAAYPLFLLALFVLILGNGAFKPNISTQVGTLYALGDPRRDRAFSVFYVGINLGAFFAPLVAGTLGEEIGWHYGFTAAGIGMTIGTVFGRIAGTSAAQHVHAH